MQTRDFALPVFRVDSAEPPLLVPGEAAVIRGAGFSHHPGWNHVFIGGYPAPVSKASETELRVTVPREIKDWGLIEVELGGRYARPFTAGIQSIISLDYCHGMADARVEVLGTSQTANIRIETSGSNYTHSEYYQQTSYYCGRNSTVIRHGGMHAPYLTLNVSLGSVMSPALFAAPLLPSGWILASYVYVQLIYLEETDPVTGEVRLIYYFYRDGRWWRVRNPELHHPDNPDLIDLEDESDDPNYTQAPPEIEERLNRQFFPTGWEEFWDEIEEPMRSDLQLMAAMLAQMEGLTAEDLELMEQIRDMARRGRSVEEIWEAKQDRVLETIFFIALGALTAGAGAMVGRRLLGRFLRRLFRSRLIRRVTRVRETADGIEIDVHPDFRPRAGRGGLQGNLNGRVNRETGTLESDPGAEEWINSTGQPGLASELMEEFIERLKDFAARMGLRRIRIRRIASTEDGVKFLRRNGFSPVEGRVDENGFGYWEKIVEVAS